MSVITLVDVEELLIQGLLRVNDDIQTHFDTRVYTRRPAEPTYPLLQIRRLGGGLTFNHPVWADRARVQYDVWSDLLPPEGEGSKKATWRAANAVRVVLMESRGIYAPHGSITYVTERIAPFELDDPDTRRIHLLGEIALDVHPIP